MSSYLPSQAKASNQTIFFSTTSSLRGSYFESCSRPPGRDLIQASWVITQQDYFVGLFGTISSYMI